MDGCFDGQVRNGAQRGRHVAHVAAGRERQSQKVERQEEVQGARGRLDVEGTGRYGQVHQVAHRGVATASRIGRAQ